MKLLNNSLYIVSTPIGNLDDITLRAIKVLKNSDIILCEDTRRSVKLLNHFKINKKLVSYHKFNEKKKLSEIIKYINEGKILSLISDAGTPLISDPGKLLIAECVNNKINIIPISGISSITASMSVSGFDDKFLFYGFLPKKEKELEKVLSTLSTNNFTQIFFLPSIKINFYIKKFKKFYKDRKIMIAREISKLHETFYRDKIEDLKLFKTKIKGEITLIVSENYDKKKTIKKHLIVNKAKKYLKKYSLRDTVNLISVAENVNKKEINKNE